MLKLIINRDAIYTVLKIRHVHGYHAFQIILSHEYVLPRFQLQCNASRHIIIAGVLDIYRNMSRANGCLNGNNKFIWPQFLAVTQQLYEWYFLSVRLSVCPSVCLSVTHFWLCSHHRIIINCSGVITKDQGNVHAKGQGHRGHNPT